MKYTFIFHIQCNATIVSFFVCQLRFQYDSYGLMFTAGATLIATLFNFDRLKKKTFPRSSVSSLMTFVPEIATQFFFFLLLLVVLFLFVSFHYFALHLIVTKWEKEKEVSVLIILRLEMKAKMKKKYRKS